MAIIQEELRQKLKHLVTETVTMLCKNTLPFKKELCLEGLLGVTMDSASIVLININETLAKDGTREKNEKDDALVIADSPPNSPSKLRDQKHPPQQNSTPNTNRNKTPGRTPTAQSPGTGNRPPVSPQQQQYLRQRSQMVQNQISQQPGSGRKRTSIPGQPNQPHSTEKKRKTVLNASQRAYLEKAYYMNSRPSNKDMAKLADELKMDKEYVKAWFNNKRSIMNRRENPQNANMYAGQFMQGRGANNMMQNRMPNNTMRGQFNMHGNKFQNNNPNMRGPGTAMQNQPQMKTPFDNAQPTNIQPTQFNDMNNPTVHGVPNSFQNLPDPNESIQYPVTVVQPVSDSHSADVINQSNTENESISSRNPPEQFDSADKSKELSTTSPASSNDEGTLPYSSPNYQKSPDVSNNTNTDSNTEQQSTVRGGIDVRPSFSSLLNSNTLNNCDTLNDLGFSNGVDVSNLVNSVVTGLMSRHEATDMNNSNTENSGNTSRNNKSNENTTNPSATQLTPESHSSDANTSNFLQLQPHI